MSMDKMAKVKCVVYCEIKKCYKQNCKEDSLSERGYKKRTGLRDSKRCTIVREVGKDAEEEKLVDPCSFLHLLVVFLFHRAHPFDWSHC